ncbi:TIGR04141 family sporadically distributed protein [Sphaerisporangium viridialbum]|uniref:TIGR04141 family sporadically distributed protein n=1 Tax=Sphaerisporangium viridialbum TaxID=46189 RepID=UPI003C71F676
MELSDGRDGTGTLGGTTAIRWLEARLAIKARQYFLIDGEWHESGADYLNGIREQIDQLINTASSTTLPPWRKGEHEKAYNLRVQHELGRASYLCLDRRFWSGPSWCRRPGRRLCTGAP